MSFTSFRQSFKQSTGTQLGARFYYRSDISAKKMVEKAKLCVDAPRLKTMDLTRPLTDGFGVNWSTFGRTWEKREREEIPIENFTTALAPQAFQC